MSNRNAQAKKCVCVCVCARVRARARSHARQHILGIAFVMVWVRLSVTMQPFCKAFLKLNHTDVAVMQYGFIFSLISLMKLSLIN